ncbi:hypothetical protein PILCRDRAFT_820405 [Piloderma croceum F 1598]|uniref:DUF6534 domain-containing protein n=1 Tax=Piloderma croceum (strain F 1598) TaxID=765440 RepID=A0A0C3FCX7_PILCF|nr:hypothetical protein PILCRDRAFT_820405 [Piloderma croceum F 1598]
MINVVEVLGPAFVGFIFCLCLYGTTLAQVIFYFWSFPDDSRRTKYLVAILCAGDTIHVCLICDMFWDVLIHGRFIDESTTLTLPWQLGASFVIVILIIFAVQSFFCLRVWRVSYRNVVAVTIIGIAATTQLVAGFVSLGYSIHGALPADFFEPGNNFFARLELISCIVCDGMISAALVYYFRKNRVGMARTEPVIQQLIILSVNMGVLLCIVTTVTLILFETGGGSYVLLASHFISSKLYVNSLIATLNSRRHFRRVVDRSMAFALPTISAGTTRSIFESVI